MADKLEKSGDKGILSRTATYTSKKARRAQTKFKQRVGKGDETKDEVFDDFVNNFNKQQAAAAVLHKELKHYLSCIVAMQVASANFSEAVKDVYEPEWSSHEQVFQLFKDSENNWSNLNKRLTEDVLEPLNSYQKPFPDVKGKIAKRARKLVDYDHARHTVDTLRAKGASKSSDQKKLSQAEEDYQKAKNVFIELTSDLYDELPALYDSRIGFYASCFQSIFTLQEVFHREAALIEHQLNDLMDQLFSDFSAGTFSTRKPFSAGLEITPNSSEKEDNDSKMSSGSLASFYDVAVPDEGDDVKRIDAKETQENEHQPACAAPSRPETAEALARSQPESCDVVDAAAKSVRAAPALPPPIPRSSPPPRPKLPPAPTAKLASEKLASSDEAKEVVVMNELKPGTTNVANDADHKAPNLPTRSAAPSADVTRSTKAQSGEPAAAMPKPSALASVAGTGGGTCNVVAYKNVQSPDNPNKCNLVVPSALYTVIATHKYAPEDEDELGFEKGDIIHVIPYDEPDEQDEGWLNGVMDSNGLKGVFPENFTKRLS